MSGAGVPGGAITCQPGSRVQTRHCTASSASNSATAGVLLCAAGGWVCAGCATSGQPRSRSSANARTTSHLPAGRCGARPPACRSLFVGNEQSALMVGRPPRSAADAPVGLRAPCNVLIPLFRMRDGGAPRGPGGPPHDNGRIRSSGKKSAALRLLAWCLIVAQARTNSFVQLLDVIGFLERRHGDNVAIVFFQIDFQLFGEFRQIGGILDVLPMFCLEDFLFLRLAVGQDDVFLLGAAVPATAAAALL